MYDNENVNWFSQTLLTFKDKQYSTDGYLKIAISTNTNDYKFFNPPLFNISISTNIQKTCNLNIQQAEDLLESFTQVLKQVNGNDIVIEKNYQKTSNIYFKFTIDKVNQTRVVVIEIVSNESDSTKIIIPLKPTFQSFVRRLKAFVENYDRICFNLLSKSINSNSVQIIERLPSLIKGISSQIISRIPEEETILDSGASEITVDVLKETSMTIADLDKFMGTDMENIKLTELKEDKVEKKPPLEIRSEFVEKYLNNNLFNLENKLVSFAVSKQPIVDLANDIKETIHVDLFKDLDEETKNSLIYVSTLIEKYLFKNYTINDVVIPSSNVILKFDGVKEPERVELAKDLLTIIGFLSNVRNKLECVTRSAYDNKALLYLYLRSFMDPFCFSYISDINKYELVSVVKNRFIYFEEKGFFDHYKKLLEENNCEAITVNDLQVFSEKVFNEISRPFINEVHNFLYSNDELKLSSKNNLKIEQIINEFITVETDYKLGSLANMSKEDLESYKQRNNITDEIMSYFTTEKKTKVKTEKFEKITPLQKWVDKYKQDIPENYREKFIEFIKDLKYDKYDFSNTDFPLDEFDENIVKALYVWNPEIDSNMKTNFTHFATLIQNEQMNKENILVTFVQVTPKDGSEWNNLNL